MQVKEYINYCFLVVHDHWHTVFTVAFRCRICEIEKERKGSLSSFLRDEIICIPASFCEFDVCGYYLEEMEIGMSAKLLQMHF